MGLQTSSSCMDLTPINQPNLVFENGVHASLHPNRHHQVIFVNLKIDYPTVFEQLIMIMGNHAHNKVCFFNKTILNIFHNLIPNKTITCNDKDPPRFNNVIRQIINKKNEIYIYIYIYIYLMFNIF